MIYKIIILILVLLALIGCHEMTHMQINNIHHCEFLSYELPFTMYVDCPTEAGNLAHSINEIVGYTLIPMFMIWFIITMKNV